MKKWILHILLFASLFSMLTTSCSQDEEVMQVGSTSGTVRIQFSLDLDGTRAAADETWGTTINTNGNRVIGNDYENKIDLGRLQVFLFDAEGRYMGEVGGLTLNPSSSNTYTFTGEVTVKGVDVTIVDRVKKLVGYTIMVTANYEGYINGNLAVTQNYIFDYIAANYRPNANGEADSYIPMWGMLNTDIPLHEDRATATTAAASNPVNIYMLRSLAKIEVNLASTVGNTYKITSAKLNKYNQAAYLLPSVPSGRTYFEQVNTSAFNTESCINAASRAIEADLVFNKVNDRKWIVYVPEYDNDGTMNIILGLENNGKDITTAVKSNIIKLNTYSDGKATTTPVDIVRNHCYQYTIRTINDGIEATLKVKVNDWNTDEETWNYKEQPSVTEDDKMGWENASVSDTEVYVPYATTDNPAICNFRISTPVGATWYATFEEQKGVYNAFKFLDSDNNEVTMMSGNVGEPAELRIITTDTTPEVESTAVLRIAVRTKDERTIIVKKLVNGSDDAEFTLVQSIQ